MKNLERRKNEELAGWNIKLRSMHTEAIRSYSFLIKKYIL